MENKTLNGIINLKKEAGMTSHDAVFALRRLLHTKKIGHAGTLDPAVCGVLPIAVGKATRLITWMQKGEKTYEGEITLGYSTTTEDATGEMVEETPVCQALTEREIDAVLAGFVGEITQIPPMFSAVKVKGRKLYEYARKGESVERPSRSVSIYSLHRTSPIEYNNQRLHFCFQVTCSKGTYVRTLAVDIGKKLGYASHLSQLTRTASAGLLLGESFTLLQIEKLSLAKDDRFLLPIEKALHSLPSAPLTAEQVTDLTYGRTITLFSQEAELAGLYQGKLVAILRKKEASYQPYKVFV